MFTLPPMSPDCTHSSDYIDGVPVVHVSEDAAAIKQFLRFCHPSAQKPSPETVYDVLQLYSLGDKYMVNSLKEYARRELQRFVVDRPVSVFMVAYHIGWKEEAAKAARETLKMSVDGIINAGGKELEHVPADILKKLSEYRRKCREAVEYPTGPTYWYRDDDERSEFFPQGELVLEPISNPFPVMILKGKPTGSRCHCIVYRDPDVSCFDRSLGFPPWQLEVGASLEVLGWFGLYLQDLRVALREKPGRMDVNSAVWMVRAMKEASQCPDCAPIAFDVLQAHAAKMESAVNSFIDKVKLEC